MCIYIYNIILLYIYKFGDSAGRCFAMVVWRGLALASRELNLGVMNWIVQFEYSQNWMKVQLSGTPWNHMKILGKNHGCLQPFNDKHSHLCRSMGIPLKDILPPRCAPIDRSRSGCSRICTRAMWNIDFRPEPIAPGCLGSTCPWFPSFLPSVFKALRFNASCL